MTTYNYTPIGDTPVDTIKLVNDIIDRVSSKRNLTLSIFVGEKGTNIHVYPIKGGNDELDPIN